MSNIPELLGREIFKHNMTKGELVEVKQQLEKLQESNRIMKEALEFVVKNSGLSTDYNKIAREALKKT